MKLTVDGVIYDLDPDSITNREAMLLEDQFGVTFQEFGALLQRGSMKAMTGLVWLAMRRENGDVAFDAVDFKLIDAEPDVPLEEDAVTSDDATP